MSKMKIKTGDTVVILTGDKNKDRGKTGKVLEVSPKEGKVIVEGLNMVSKHVKPRKAGDPSGIVKAESAIYACKVQVVCPKCKKPLLCFPTGRGEAVECPSRRCIKGDSWGNYNFNE